VKTYEREEARRLRREEGLSVKEICKRLGVSKGSVSVWVRDIELTDEQKAVLNYRKATYGGQFWGSKAVAKKHRDLRQQYQEEGRAKAREKDPLHIAGCMLYWAEGTKAKNALALINSDADMLRFYLTFLRQSLGVQDEDIKLYINCYLNNGISLDDIQSHWLRVLQLPEVCLRNATINAQPISSQQKGRKLQYGVCKVIVHNTRLVQHVFGAIQEYARIEKPEWLM
jgi:transcriptional regulator with XRE-family HTH domain